MRDRSRAPPQPEGRIDVAEIVHDIDVKDRKFEPAEAAGYASVIAAIALTKRDDEERIAFGDRFSTRSSSSIVASARCRRRDDVDLPHRAISRRSAGVNVGFEVTVGDAKGWRRR